MGPHTSINAINARIHAKFHAAETFICQRMLHLHTFSSSKASRTRLATAQFKVRMLQEEQKIKAREQELEKERQRLEMERQLLKARVKMEQARMELSSVESDEM